MPVSNDHSPSQTGLDDIPSDIDDLFRDYVVGKIAPGATAGHAAFGFVDAFTRRRTVELLNGELQLALLPVPRRDEGVIAQLSFLNGNENTLKGTRAPADALGDLLLTGTPDQTEHAIAEGFLALNARVTIETYPGETLVYIDTTGRNLPEAIKQVLNIVRTADFPQEQLENYRAEVKTSVAIQQEDQYAVAELALSRHYGVWPVEDVRYIPTFEESTRSADNLDREQLVYYRDTFVGAHSVKFSAVGQFDAEAVTDAVVSALSLWPSGKPFSRVPYAYRPIPPTRFELVTPDQAFATYRSYLSLPLQATAAEFPALELANFLLSDAESSPLLTQLRDKGVVDNVHSRLEASLFEPNAGWSVYASFLPGGRDRLESALADVFRRALADGFSDQEVADAKAAILNYRAQQLAEEGWEIATWQEYLNVGGRYDWLKKPAFPIENVTAEAVNSALRKYLNPADFSVVIVENIETRTPHAPLTPKRP